jgi:ectoine hydroxylase-related dioxygenase (phytanoyl-CoA dioxygenase family)
MDSKMHKQEMDIYGATSLGKILSDEDINFFREDLLKKTKEEELQYGKEELIRIGAFETVLDLGRFGGKYYEIIENKHINTFINTVLNDKAVIHSFNGIINKAGDRSGMVGFHFHRDMPYFKETRTAVNVMIPLVDYNAANGATEYVPSTHLFKKMPSQEFLEKHKVTMQGKAGEAFVTDAVTWHRAGTNSTSQDRPMIVLKFTLAPFKQQIDYIHSTGENINSASDLVKQRLGINVIVSSDHEMHRWPERRKWRSGQYDMSNTDMHDFMNWE